MTFTKEFENWAAFVLWYAKHTALKFFVRKVRQRKLWVQFTNEKV